MSDMSFMQEPALEPYILFVLQAEEFCDLISSGKFLDHVLEARSLYPTFTICYVTHKLMKYIYDRLVHLSLNYHANCFCFIYVVLFFANDR